MRPPRGLIVSTGEDVPQGQSLNARQLVLELPKGAVDWQRLTTCQRDAATGLYAQAMAGFIKWISPRYEQFRQTFRDEVSKLRDAAYRIDQHRRTPGIVAELAFGMYTFLTYAEEVNAISEATSEALRKRTRSALVEAALAQTDHQQTSEPTRRFLELLRAALASGRAHLAGPDGREPVDPEVWGWREVTTGSGEYKQNEWRPGGNRVGWVNGEDVFLEPQASYAAAQNLARDAGNPIAVASKTLHKRLQERGILASTEDTRGTLTIRRRLEGARRSVLHLYFDTIMSGQSDQTAQSDLEGRVLASDIALDGSDSWAVSAAPHTETAQEKYQMGVGSQGEMGGNGQIGQIGQIGQFSELLQTDEGKEQTSHETLPSPEPVDPWDRFLEEVGLGDS